MNVNPTPTKTPTLWAIYRDGEKVNSREGYDKSSARVQTVNLLTNYPGVRWAIGSYHADLGLAPQFLKDCRSTEEVAKHGYKESK